MALLAEKGVAIAAAFPLLKEQNMETIGSIVLLVLILIVLGIAFGRS